MKNLFILTLLSLCFTFGAQAQNTVRVGGGGGGLAYDEGTSILNIGLGLGRTVRSYNYAWWGYSGIGASLNASYEIGFHEYFSAGLYAGLGRYNIVRGWNMTAIAAGVRGSFHYVALANEALDLGLNEDKLDLYVSLIIGAEVISTNIDDEFFESQFDGGAYVDFGTLLGGRYMFNERFGVYSEIGYGALSVWTLGVTMNL